MRLKQLFHALGTVVSYAWNSGKVGFCKGKAPQINGESALSHTSPKSMVFLWLADLSGDESAITFHNLKVLYFMKSKILLAASIFLAATTQAQDLTTPQPDNWHIGVGGGLHSSFLQYSDLDEDIYP